MFMLKERRYKALAVDSPASTTGSRLRWGGGLYLRDQPGPQGAVSAATLETHHQQGLIFYEKSFGFIGLLALLDS